MNTTTIEIYTDGSCNQQANIGAWGAILLINDEQTVIHGIRANTTHNRMELLAVIESLHFLLDNDLTNVPVKIYTDSQYVERIQHRKQKILQQNFLTKNGKLMSNADLVEILIYLTADRNISFVKVKAHQKSEEIPNLNREVDKFVRKLVRESSRLKM